MIKTIQFAFFFLNFTFLPAYFSPALGQRGSVIIIQTKGSVNAYSPVGVKLRAAVTRGSVLPEGYSLETGFLSESILLFSNGTIATLQENSKLKLSEFAQKPFDAPETFFGQLKEEPSESRIALEVEIGSLIVQTKKLNKDSFLSVKTPLGTAGIRGTQFQLAISPQAGLTLDVAESRVSFTPSGENRRIFVGPDRGLDASAGGSLKQRPISSSAAKNIRAKNLAASSSCAAVRVTTAKLASKKAQQMIGNQETGDEPGESEDESGPEEKEDDDEGKQSNASGNRATEALLSRSNLVFSRTVSAAEIQRVQKEIADARIEEAGSILIPPNAVPSSLPGTPPKVGKSVVYSFDPEERLVSIGLYEDGIPVPLEVSFLDLEDLKYGDNFELILSMFENWAADDDLKIINAIGLDVFSEEILANPYKYDDFNMAVQHAVSLAKSFLEQITLTTLIPADKVRNARGLIDEFANNPYAYEFAKLLARHGAISNPSNQAATDNILKLLGSEKLSDTSYLYELLGQTILPGASFNSQELNGGLIGARNASIDPATSQQLQIRLQNANALVGGDIFISAGASIDLSSFLPSKGENDGTKIFIIAAAKDLSIQGDVTFDNDNHAEDHALAFGSAGNLNVQAGSTIKYHGSNLGIGTAGDLKLLNVDIDVGGNLAIGSLGDLDIEFTEPGSKLFSVGRYSDRDNVYLYANDMIKAQGLRFNDRAREIYMEAITVNLKDVNFPENSKVMLRSQNGTLDFGTFSNPRIGGVNLTDVKHLGIASDRPLQKSDFSGSDGKWNSKATPIDATPALRVRAFTNANKESGVN